MPVVHLMCGLAGSGKTITARRIADEAHGIRFTLDEWMIQLFDLAPEDPRYAAEARRVKELIWTVGAEVLHGGRDVVLDWSHWSRASRRDSRDHAAELGARAIVHYVDTPLDVATARLRHRNTVLPPGTHPIDIVQMRQFSVEFFEPPTPDEGIEIIRELAS